VLEGEEVAITAAVDELTALVVDHLLPIVHRHRTAVAARIDVGPPELLCLDLLRRLGPLPSGTVGERVGLTRSTTSKMLRRLESAGHVSREPDPAHRQGQVVRLVPHHERDRTLEAFHRQVRSTIRSIVTARGLHRPRERALVAESWILLVDGLQRAVDGECERTWWERAKVRRRKAREAAGRR
jgi:hypothetical protein